MEGNIVGENISVEKKSLCIMLQNAEILFTAICENFLPISYTEFKSMP